jgi:hypothetical protein
MSARRLDEAIDDPGLLQDRMQEREHIADGLSQP